MSRPGVAGSIARWLADLTRKLFRHWHAFTRGESDRPTLASRLEPLQPQVRAALQWGAASRVAKFAGFCQNLLNRWEALWTFVRVEGVEPTNNAAERAVRQGVLWRKVSLFSQSERGRTYVERVLTVKTTLRQQGANLLAFLTESLRAARTGAPAPSVFGPVVGLVRQGVEASVPKLLEPEAHPAGADPQVAADLGHPPARIGQADPLQAVAGAA